ncbi:MAG: ABC transporter permease [Candidatus Sumerlaeota bacterium]|nr:ABC transporter permease [Candidatus Sumerlaeota bacterium]
MKNSYYIFKREFRAYFTSPLAYVFLVVFLALINFLFFFYNPFFLRGVADARILFSLFPWFFLFFVPAFTMRLWAEEARHGTIEFLMTLPLRDIEVVVGKFAASFLFLFIAALLTLGIPITVSQLAEGGKGIDWGPVWGGYFGVMLLGGAYLAIGMFVSSLTRNQIIAYILGVVTCFALFILGDQMTTAYIWQPLAPLMAYLGLQTHFERLLLGIVDTRDVIYYLSVIVFFLYLNVQKLDSRNYR